MDVSASAGSPCPQFSVKRMEPPSVVASHARSTQVGHDVQGSFCIPQDTCTQLDTRYSYYYYKASGPLVLCLVVGRLGVEGGGGGVEGVALAVVCVLFG